MVGLGNVAASTIDGYYKSRNEKTNRELEAKAIEEREKTNQKIAEIEYLRSKESGKKLYFFAILIAIVLVVLIVSILILRTKW
ncbi:MAG: hypothetical protein QXR53_05070 [Candidatus Norongarragalinales archaeon]